MKILLAITCYRCEKQITRVLEKLSQSIFISKIDHIAIIDNPSPDGTLKNAAAGAELPGFNNKAVAYLNNANYGLGGSHKIAFDLAAQLAMDYVFILHGDDQAEIGDIENFLISLDQHPSVSAILGSRFSKGSKLFGYQKKRIMGNVVLNVIYTLLTFRKTVDLGSGLNLFKVSDLGKISYHELSNQFTFNAELLLSMYSLNLDVIFLPIVWKEEDQESNAGNLSVALKMLKALICWRFFRLPKEKSIDYKTSKV